MLDAGPSGPLVGADQIGTAGTAGLRAPFRLLPIFTLQRKVLCMRATVYDPAPATHPRTQASGLTPALGAAVGSAALSLGIVGDTLFHDGVGSVSFALWIAVVALTVVALVWHAGRTLPREAALWLASAVAFASCLVRRNSEILNFLDGVAAVGCLALAVVRLRDRRAGILAERMRDTVAGVVRACLETAFGILPLALRELPAARAAAPTTSRWRTVVRPVVLALVVLVVFGSLLREADPIFASIASLPRLDFGNLVSHAVVIAFLTAFVAGGTRSALLPTPSDSRVPDGYGFTLGTADVVTILGTLNVLFATFVVAQLGWFFGGEQFLRERTGLTVAEYARGGFFQLLWIVALVVPVLVVTRGALPPADRALARRHTLLALPVIGLLGAMIAGATARFNLYVKFYGMTTDRLYPMVFMAWLFVTLIWLSVTVLRDWGRPFAVGAATSAMVTLFALNAADPDAFVARVNVNRAVVPGAIPLDVAHLATLSGGGVPYAVDALIAAKTPLVAGSPEAAARCTAAKQLLRRFGPTSETRRRAVVGQSGAWRFWNADDALGTAAVARHFAELLAIRHEACALEHAPAANSGSPSPTPGS